MGGTLCPLQVKLIGYCHSALSGAAFFQFRAGFFFFLLLVNTDIDIEMCNVVHINQSVGVRDYFSISVYIGCLRVLINSLPRD